ncbi:MAG: hypothetical protein ACYTEX_11300 [Planctomycetota bacterium]|jgi:hypothetical protein
MSFVDDTPGYEIVTSEQATNCISEQIALLEKALLGCAVEFPGNKERTGRLQRKAYRVFLEKHGGALGMLAVFRRYRLLSKEVYKEFRVKMMALLGPSSIEKYDWFFETESEDLTEEQAHRWLIDQIDALESARLRCNVYYPGDEDRTIETQKAADFRFVMKLGGILGMIVALHRCRLLGDVAYNEFRSKAMATLIPTVVGNT